MRGFLAQQLIQRRPFSWPSPFGDGFESERRRSHLRAQLAEAGVIDDAPEIRLQAGLAAKGAAFEHTGYFQTGFLQEILPTGRQPPPEGRRGAHNPVLHYPDSFILPMQKSRDKILIFSAHRSFAAYPDTALLSSVCFMVFIAC